MNTPGMRHRTAEVVDSTAWAFGNRALPHRYERDPEAWTRLDARLDAMTTERGGC